MSLLLAAGTGGFSGSAALNVLQPALAATGTSQDQFTGSAALTVPQPIVAGVGTLTVFITGTAAVTVGQPVVAASGTLTVFFTGVAALTVPPPSVSATGTGPPSGVGGRPHKRSTVHRYPVKRARVADLGLTVHDLHTGDAKCAIRPPQMRSRGFVEAPSDPEEDTRTLVKMALEDEDLVLAYTMAESWLN